MKTYNIYLSNGGDDPGIIKEDKYGVKYITNKDIINSINDDIMSEDDYSKPEELASNLIELLKDNSDGTFNLTKQILKNLSKIIDVIDEDNKTLKYLIKAVLANIDEY